MMREVTCPKQVKKGDPISVSHYDNDEYVELYGHVKHVYAPGLGTTGRVRVVIRYPEKYNGGEMSIPIDGRFREVLWKYDSEEDIPENIKEALATV